MSDSKGASIDELLRQLEVDLFEVVGDEFAPKQENGSPERKRLLRLLSQSYPIFAEAKQAILAILAQEVNKARIDENQIYLDRINNYKPEPGQLTAASFGSAGAAMETAGWKHSFEDRIKDLERLG